MTWKIPTNQKAYPASSRLQLAGDAVKSEAQTRAQAGKHPNSNAINKGSAYVLANLRTWGTISFETRTNCLCSCLLLFGCFVKAGRLHKRIAVHTASASIALMSTGGASIRKTHSAGTLNKRSRAHKACVKPFCDCLLHGADLKLTCCASMCRIQLVKSKPKTPKPRPRNEPTHP